LDPSTLQPAAPSLVPSAGIEKQDPRYVKLQRQVAVVGTAVWGVVGLGAIAMIVAWSGQGGLLRVPLIVATAVALVAHAWWGQYKPGLAYRHASFRVDELGIEIRQGVFWRSVIDVPRSRVQHTDVSQGPWERRHGLGTLEIYTAGVSFSMVALPGLDHARALAIRDTLLPRERGVST
jgi:membrane protein YdbS with pleckstrin-like domain